MIRYLLLLLLPLTLFGQSQKISDMTSATSLTGSEYVPIVQTTNKKATVGLLRGWTSLGTAGQLLKVNSGATALEFFTPSYLTSVGTGVANELTYWSGTSTLGSLATATYPSLTELSYVKGVTSAIQTQLNSKSGTLTNGNGTTANGSAVDLGGVQSGNIDIDPAVAGTYEFRVGYTRPVSRIVGYTDFEIDFRSDNSGYTQGSSLLLQNSNSQIRAYGSGYDRRINFNNSGVILDLGSDATGDTYYRNSSGYFTRLAAGTNGHVLTLADGIPSWAAPSGGSGLTVGTSTITSGTNTRVLYNNSGVLGEYTVSGSGNVAMTISPTFTTPNIGTATGTASGNVLLAGGTYTNTTGDGFALTSSTVTSGNLVNFTNTGTAAASNTKTVLNVASSGANGTSTQTTYGARFANTNTGTSSTNIGASFSASGGSTNYAAYIAAGELKFASGGTIANTTGNLTISSAVNFSNGQVTLSGSRQILFNGGGGEMRADANSSIGFRSNAGATVPTGGYYRFYNVNVNYTATSGTQNVMANETSFAPTSGTAVFNAYLGSGTINQTGGANGNVSMIALTPTYTAAGGDVYGFRYNPTVTSITGVHNAFQASSGNLLIGGATLATSGIFGFNNTTKEIMLNGMRIWTDHDTNSKDNSFIGYNAGNTSVAGIDNIGYGPGVLTDLTSGSDNVAIGNLAGNDLTDGSNNILIGKVTGNALTSGSGNVIVGQSAGELVTGSNNILMGISAGNAITSGGANVVIGVDIDPQSNTASNQLTLQNAIFGSANSSTGTTVSTGNIGFYATTWGTSASKVISLGNGTAPSTSIADGVQIYAEDVTASSELKVRDEAGNITTLSPHNFTLTQPSEAGAWSHYSEYTNPETGEREAVNVDMLKLARLIEQLTGEKLVYKTTLKK